MNKLCYSAFVAFWSSVATIAALNSLAGESSPGEAAPVTRVYSLEEVAAHNTAADCWMVIEGRVYDLTAYLPRHPAPPAVINAHCGSEATTAMQTKGYGNNHSQYAWQLLSEYGIGELGETPR